MSAETIASIFVAVGTFTLASVTFLIILITIYNNKILKLLEYKNQTIIQILHYENLIENANNTGRQIASQPTNKPRLSIYEVSGYIYKNINNKLNNYYKDHAELKEEVFGLITTRTKRLEVYILGAFYEYDDFWQSIKYIWPNDKKKLKLSLHYIMAINVNTKNEYEKNIYPFRKEKGYL